MADMEALVAAVREHSGMDLAQLRDAGQYGSDAGWPGFTYTADGAAFYREHADLVDELLADMADDCGYPNVAALVATFVRADMADTRDGRDCLLAWFALEEAGRYVDAADLTDEDEDEDDGGIEPFADRDYLAGIIRDFLPEILEP